MNFKITGRKVFYREDTDMRKSFPGLIEISEKEIKAKMLQGDVIVFDNHNKTRRKILARTKDGWILYYMWRMNTENVFAMIKDGEQTLPLDN